MLLADPMYLKYPIFELSNCPPRVWLWSMVAALTGDWWLVARRLVRPASEAGSSVVVHHK